MVVDSIKDVIAKRDISYNFVWPLFKLIDPYLIIKEEVIQNEKLKLSSDCSGNPITDHTAHIQGFLVGFSFAFLTILRGARYTNFCR